MNCPHHQAVLQETIAKKQKTLKRLSDMMAAQDHREDEATALTRMYAQIKHSLEHDRQKLEQLRAIGQK